MLCTVSRFFFYRMGTSKMVAFLPRPPSLYQWRTNMEKALEPGLGGEECKYSGYLNVRRMPGVVDTSLIGGH